MRRTKIVCTLGPASFAAETIEALIRGGMNVARLNFSHGTREEHGEKIALIRALSEKLRLPVGILQDLAGPKIRVGWIPDPGIELRPGETFVLTNRTDGEGGRVSVSYPTLPQEVKAGDRLLLADGLLELSVETTTETDIVCRVVTGGRLTSHKGINLPTGTLRAPSLTEKDREDLRFGIAQGVDFVALSFVRSPDDIREVQQIIRQAGCTIPVVAKIEKHEALTCLDAIVAVADGIMVARGDLGVEIPLEEVPLVQKWIIRSANARGKFVITATQMLRSMVSSPRPTRAEAGDVANAVLDGTDAVMLSEETASGEYPLEAVRYMDHICLAAEKGLGQQKRRREGDADKGVSESVARAACLLADQLEARAIVTYTFTGSTARAVSRYRPLEPILAISPDPETVRRLTIAWGCRSFHVEVPRDTDDLLEKASLLSLDDGGLAPGDRVVMTFGHPLCTAGSTNTLQVKQL